MTAQNSVCNPRYRACLWVESIGACVYDCVRLIGTHNERLDEDSRETNMPQMLKQSRDASPFWSPLNLAANHLRSASWEKAYCDRSKLLFFRDFEIIFLVNYTTICFRGFHELFCVVWTAPRTITTILQLGG